MGSIEDINVIIATPLPLPYANLCKLLLTLWMFSFPFVEDFSVGLFGGITIPIVIMGSLLAIDLISTELENPFGDDTNDLDLIEQIHILECEALEMLEYCGDFKARSAFIWRGLPDRMADTSCKPVTHQLALAKLAEGFQDVVGGRTEKTLLSFQDGQFGVKDLRGSTPARGMSKGVAATAAKALAKAPLLDPPPPPQSSVARSYSGGSLGSAEEETNSDESDSEEER
ncbi:unnamed protein product [Polarella glacialis]|uniref:Bestrophin homolog n=1 Tax=Polarella glacialis TaxID=89957 RepID=A0A813HWF0_POLGL|nr:unnamed protein product [Polarella glacialis]